MSFRVAGTFLTPDGTLWNNDGGWLRRFSNGRWGRIARLPRRGPYQPLALPTEGPPWLIFDSWREEPCLWDLVSAAEGARPRLSILPLREADQGLFERAVAPWTDRGVLLSTDSGLRTYDARTRTVARVDLPVPSKPATTLARDGLGRFWLGNDEGLYLAVSGAKSVEEFDVIAEFRDASVLTLAPDPAHADGVVASLGARGIAFVRAIEP